MLLLQRKETLLVELKKLGRGNKTVDARIGERDANMSYDEKMGKRFALERKVKNAIAYQYRILFLSNELY